MYKDLLGIVSVLCMVWYPHQVVAEESLCHLDFRPQPYSLKEEVGDLVWEYPKVPSQWKTDQSEQNIWKELPHLEQKQIAKSRRPVWNLQQELWNSSKKEKMKHQRQVEGTRKSLRFPKLTGEQPLRLRLSVLEKALRLPREPKVEQNGSKKRRLPGKKKSGTGKQRSLQGKLRRLKKRSLKEPLRRRQFEGSWMLPWRLETAGSIESVLLLEREYKALQRDPSHKPNFYFLIDRLISNLRHIPRTVFGPPAGEEERVKLTKLREAEEAEDAEAAKNAAAGMEEADEGSASRKRKLEELEEKKRVLEEESIRRRKELEEESRRLRAVEEAERRARDQRSKNPKLQVPVAAEKVEKGETWFERKATELVESYIQAYGPQQKKSKEAATQHVAIRSRHRKTSYLHFRKLRRVQKDFRKVLGNPWKRLSSLAVKRNAPSCMPK